MSKPPEIVPKDPSANVFAKTTDMRELLAMLVGAGSMAWQPKPTTQEFDSTYASWLVDQAEERIRLGFITP